MANVETRRADGDFRAGPAAATAASGSAKQMDDNLDPQVTRGFGEEWSTFRQDKSSLPHQQRTKIFDDYFRIFPWHLLPAGGGVGIDVGCGTGRWSMLVAPRVAHLHLLDASPEALAVARENLQLRKKRELPRQQRGRDPAAAELSRFRLFARRSASRPGYPGRDRRHRREAQAGRAVFGLPLLRVRQPSGLVSAFWRWQTLAVLLISRLPHPLRLSRQPDRLRRSSTGRWRARRDFFSARPSCIACRSSCYADKSFYVMRTDAYDRFCTRLEKRFTRSEIEADVEHARVSTCPVLRHAAVLVCRRHQVGNVTGD